MNHINLQPVSSFSFIIYPGHISKSLPYLLERGMDWLCDPEFSQGLGCEHGCGAVKHATSAVATPHWRQGPPLPVVLHCPWLPREG